MYYNYLNDAFNLIDIINQSGFRIMWIVPKNSTFHFSRTTELNIIRLFLFVVLVMKVVIVG